MSSTEIDTICAKGKELCRNKPPRFSLKAPVGFRGLKRKKGFLSCWSPACQTESPQVGHVILWPGSLRDPLWLSLAIFQQSQQNYFHLLVSFKISVRIFAWTSNLSGSQEARLKGSSGAPRCWKSKSYHFCSVLLQVQMTCRWEEEPYCWPAFFPTQGRVSTMEITSAHGRRSYIMVSCN